MRDTFAYAGYNSKNDEIVLAFRGTNGADLENWITNIKGICSPYPGVTGAQVHTGFFQAYSDV
jgi:Lipase (class 3)